MKCSEQKTEGAIMRSGRAKRRGERGSVLIIALLIVLALTALGLVGLRQAAFELNTSANSRYSAQAFHISNSALIAFSERVGGNGQAYWNYLTDLRKFNVNQSIADGSTQESALASTGISYSASKGTLFGTSAFFRPLGSACNSPTGVGPFTKDCTGFGENNRNFTFAVRLSDPRDGPKAPGYSSNFCFKRFQFTSRSWVGPASSLPILSNSPGDLTDRGSGMPNMNDPSELSTRGHVTYALIGPLDCSGGYYN